MKILGINAYHGDAAACLMEDGKVVTACEEERFRRIKHCAGFPKLAIEACLKERGIGLQDIDFIGISRDPTSNFSEKAFYALLHGKELSKLIQKRFSTAAKAFRLQDEFKKYFNVDKLRAKIVPVEHHMAHMASCFYPSAFDQAAILSIDGFGDFVSTKMGFGNEKQIKILDQVYFPHSVGIFYTAITQYLGFHRYGDEYKVMGLAAYGKPKYRNEFKQIILTHPKNGFRLGLDYFVHHSQGIEMNWDDGYPTQTACFSQKLIDLFGPAREPGSIISDHHRDIAASLQQTFEIIFFHLLNQLYQKTKTENLCLAGGCALNSVANGKITSQTPFKRVFIQPVAGDAGTALGGALHVEYVVVGQERRFLMNHTYFGPTYQKKDAESVLKKSELPFQELNEHDLIRRTAQALADGKIIGWFQGKMEFGPRALGNRSVLADPRRAEMQSILNERIKNRENFRPFAPSLLLEEVGNYFEDPVEEPFMIRVMKVKEDKRSLIPAVTHFDGTGRLHTVDKTTNPKYWRLINEFKQITGIPVLLNTSFNEHEPIVCTPGDAIKCFVATGMDILVIDNFWVEQIHEKSARSNTGLESNCHSR